MPRSASEPIRACLPPIVELQENERLRSEVGELKTARLSASAMAARLEEMNTLSIRVASLKMEMAALKSEQDIREDELVAQIAVLQHQLAKRKKRRSPGKMIKKTLSNAVDSLRGHASGGASAAAATSPRPAASPRPAVEASPAGAGSDVRRSWGSLKSKLTSFGARGRDEEAATAAAASSSPRHH